MKISNVKIFDIYITKSSFTYVSIDSLKKGEYKEIHIETNNSEWRKNLDDLYIELKSLDGMIGYNNLNYSYPLIHYIINMKKSFENLDSARVVIDSIIKESVNLLGNDFNHIKHKDQYIIQCDLFSLWGFYSRRVPLSTLKFNLELSNIVNIIDNSRKNIIEFLKNNIEAIHALYLLSGDKIELRKKILKDYGIMCLNFSDSKISEDLMLKLYCEMYNKDYWDIRSLRTSRDIIKFDECIPKYIKFKTEKFNNILNELKELKIREFKNSFSKIFLHKEVEYTMTPSGIYSKGSTGVHGLEDEVSSIIESDLNAAYPTILINDNLYPAHLDKGFVDLFRTGIIESIDKGGNNLINKSFKNISVSIIGKFDSRNSFLYDPLVSVKISLRVQLLMLMLIERITEEIPDIKIIQLNTDGLICSLSKINIDRYNDIINNFSKEYNLSFKNKEYNSVVINNSNSYIAIDKDKSYKTIDIFNTNDARSKTYNPSKDTQMRIIPIALKEYFINGKDIATTIINHNNIYDFCIRNHTRSSNEIHSISNSKHIIKKVSGTNRYFISNKGGKLISLSDTGRRRDIEVGFYITLFNRYDKRNIEDYDINYNYYISKCNIIINNIKNNQLKLF